MKSKFGRTFWFSMGITLAALIFVIGVVTVDFRGRRLSFGDSTPPIKKECLENGKVNLQIKLLGIEKTVDITEIDNIWNLFLDFSCIPH